MEVNCPTCKNSVVWDQSSPYRPFCSKRCQLIDLGEWSQEQKVIPGTPNKGNDEHAVADIEEIEAMLAEQDQGFFKD